MKALESTQISSAREIFKHGFVHSVYFWLQPDLSKAQIEEFESALRQFIDDSEFASSGHIGKPAGTPREIVDNSYDYSLIVTFENADQHQAYQDEKPHDVFRVVAKKYAQRVQIYDSAGI